MALKNWSYIYLSPGFDPETHRFTQKSEQCSFTAVGLDFAAKARVTDVATQLAREGSQLIELCGGFGPIWIAKVSERLEAEDLKLQDGSSIPVGSVAYGPEARQPMLNILSPR